MLLALCAIGPALVVAASNGKLQSTAGERAVIVGALALLVIGSTIATVIHVRRRPDTRSALMAVAFVGMSMVLIARVLAMVPGALYSPGITRIAEMLTLPLGALILALSGTPSLHKRKRVETVAQSAQALGLFLLVVLALVFSARDDIPTVPRPGSDTAIAMFVVTSALLVVLARRAARTAALSERPGDVLVTPGRDGLDLRLLGPRQRLPQRHAVVDRPRAGARRHRRALRPRHPRPVARHRVTAARRRPLRRRHRRRRRGVPRRPRAPPDAPARPQGRRDRGPYAPRRDARREDGASGSDSTPPACATSPPADSSTTSASSTRPTASSRSRASSPTPSTR
ncbi:MAG: hypothetical protein PGN13_07985 [Patulibacter minatonensis]